MGSVRQAQLQNIKDGAQAPSFLFAAVKCLRESLLTWEETPAIIFLRPFCASGEMADALASGASARKGVEVRVFSRASKNRSLSNPWAAVFCRLVGGVWRLGVRLLKFLQLFLLSSE